MPNQARDQTVIEVDGNRLPIRYEANALAELEDLLDTNISALGRSLSSGNVGITEMRAFLYAGLLHLGDYDDMGRCVEPYYTLKECGKFVDEMMQKKGMEDTFEKLGEALQKAMGVDDEELEEIENEKKTGGDGSGSEK